MMIMVVVVASDGNATEALPSLIDHSRLLKCISQSVLLLIGTYL